MEILYGKRFIHIRSGADPFTGMMAHPAADAGKRMGVFEQRQRFAVFFLFDQGDVSLYAHMCGARCLAGCGVPFCDGKGAGNGLCVFLENGMLLAQSLIILIGQIHGTYFGAIPAGGTLGWIDKARRFLNRYFEVPRGAFYFFHLGGGD